MCDDLVKTVMSAELRNAASSLEVQLGLAVVALQSRIEDLKREVETHTISVDEARTAFENRKSATGRNGRA